MGMNKSSRTPRDVETKYVHVYTVLYLHLLQVAVSIKTYMYMPWHLNIKIQITYGALSTALVYTSNNIKGPYSSTVPRNYHVRILHMQVHMCNT